MNKLIRQMIYFIGISGIGWLIDFSLYMLLGGLFLIQVGAANMISALIAANFMFFVSVKKLRELSRWIKGLAEIPNLYAISGCTDWMRFMAGTGNL